MATTKNDNGSTTHTRPFATPTAAKASGKGETADQYAERSIVERHGEAIRNNPQFKALVAEEKRQIEENRHVTEGM